MIASAIFPPKMPLFTYGETIFLPERNYFFLVREKFFSGEVANFSSCKNKEETTFARFFPFVILERTFSMC